MELCSCLNLPLLLSLVSSVILNALVASASLAPLNEPLALKYVDKACEAKNLSQFYLSVRSAYQTDRKLPEWNDPAGPSNDISNHPGVEVYWDENQVHSFVPSYDSFRGEVLQYGAPASYKWCVHIYSLYDDIHGCWKNGVVSGTPLFEMIGLMDRIRGLSAAELRFPLYLLGLLRINLLSYVNGNDLWHNAMVVFTADWNRTEVETVSNFFIVNNGRTRIQYIREFPRQDDAFLVAGEKKEFACISFGGYRSLPSGWVHGHNIRVPVALTPSYCKDSRNRTGNCSSFSTIEEFYGSGNCVQYNPVIYNYGSIRHKLVFWNPTAEDTGSFSCYVRYRNNDNRGYNESIYVYVVFLEVPRKDDVLWKNNGSQINFMVKAPINSTLNFFHNSERLTNSDSASIGTSVCNDVPIIHQSSSSIDDFYSLYSAEIKICNTTESNAGIYEAQVYYFVEEEENVAKFKQSLSVKSKENATKPSSSEKNSNTLLLPVTLGVAGGCAVLIVVVALFTIAVTCVSHRTVSKCSLHLETPVPLTITSDSQKSKKLSAPNEANVGPMEFLRENLDFHEQLGKGRFGKVVRASAYRIVPHMPSVNTVAVKTANSKASHSHSRKMMLAELSTMQQLEAHTNICNLLAFCTLDDPVLIIMEYACHGNLKQHLGLCSQAVLQAKKSPVVAGNDEYLNVQDNEKSQIKTPGLITETLLKQYAYQIASGLDHLVSMDVVHRDLAARNILISEGFVLKIGDFGMATTVSDEGNYHRIIDDTEIVAVKWAALETLENKGYFFKSDVWSFGVIIWEIASYGDEPFKKVSVGLTLNKFIEHLRSGHRLTRPPGLSDEIYKMLTCCWCEEVENRPKASDLKTFFQN